MAICMNPRELRMRFLYGCEMNFAHVVSIKYLLRCIRTGQLSQLTYGFLIDKIATRSEICVIIDI